MIQTAPSSDRRTELTDFLRTRRARLAPSDVGLLDGARRRTPGLRREEVALLANIGSTWYTRLEQGLPINVSPQVLDSIAIALRLSDAERAHLYVLAGQPTPERTDAYVERVSPLLLRTLDALEPNPAIVRGRRFDMLAWNRASERIWGKPDDSHPFARNTMWRLFVERRLCALYPQWNENAPRIVAQFRAVAARYPDDPAFKSLIAQLLEHSDEFARLWAQHNVSNVTDGLKHIHHPIVGELTLDHTTLFVPDYPDMRVIVFTAQAGSESERKLFELRDRCA